MNRHREHYVIARNEALIDALCAVGLVLLSVGCGVLLAWRG